jgi:hypothetical protein
MTTHNIIIKVFPDDNQWCAVIENPPSFSEPEFGRTAAEAVGKLSDRLCLLGEEQIEEDSDRVEISNVPHGFGKAGTISTFTVTAIKPIESPIQEIIKRIENIERTLGILP